MTKCKCVDWITLVFFLFIAVSCSESNSKRPREIIVGGDNVVMILDFDNSSDSVKKVNWYMKTVDDHKSVDNHAKILICSSSGGTLLVDRATRKCLFYAITPNAHSVEYLPGNRIAVALSTAFRSAVINTKIQISKAEFHCVNLLLSRQGQEMYCLTL